MAEKLNTVHLTDRASWRKWLEKNHKSETEVWLVYYKKHTGKPRVAYNEAVEEAICFGWIDSTVKKLDKDRYCQKFTPRADDSRWSELNRKRAGRMIEGGMMTEAGLEKVEAARKSGEWDRVREKKEELTVPPELDKALSKNKAAHRNFYNFAPSYRRLYIGWVKDAKRKTTREKRIARVVELSAENMKPGMM